MVPRAKIKRNKQDKLDKLTKSFSEAKSAVFVDYKGMTVATVSDFRNTIREVGGRMVVSKNTLIKLAAKKAGYPEEALSDELLEGQTAVILAEGDDAVSPIQVLGKFVKENEMPTIKAGVLDSKFYNAKGVLKISKLPSKDQLYANIVGAIAGPMYALVGTLNSPAQKLVLILNARKEQLEQ